MAEKQHADLLIYCKDFSELDFGSEEAKMLVAIKF